MNVQFKEWKCLLKKEGRYPNDRKAMFLLGAPGTDYEYESIATCTVNLPDENLEEGYVHIKEWSENEGMTEALIKAGVIESEFKIVPVGPYGSFATLCKLKIDM